jgi:hypothetical protein
MPNGVKCAAFEYPAAPHVRRHGPRGYASYKSYRQWLRDEFSFRCVFCLAREQWGRESREFDLDHFVPQATDPDLAANYDNLLYACARCNARKGRRKVPDPTLAFIRDAMRVLPDGTLEAGSSDAARLIWILDLNSPQAVRWRQLWIRNVELAFEHDGEQYLRLMQFPDDLPDLSRLKPPAGNTRPDGVQRASHALRRRGELPEVY